MYNSLTNISPPYTEQVIIHYIASTIYIYKIYIYIYFFQFKYGTAVVKWIDQENNLARPPPLPKKSAIKNQRVSGALKNTVKISLLKHRYLEQNQQEKYHIKIAKQTTNLHFN